MNRFKFWTRKFWTSENPAPEPTISVAQQPVSDTKDATSTVTKIAYVPPVKSPGLTFVNRTTYWNGDMEYIQPEYDISEMSVIEDTESFLRQALKKKTSLAFKNGWDVVGKNKQITDYVRRRFLQIEQASDTPLDVLLRELFHCFVRDHNAFLVKVRDSERSGGQERPGFRRRSTLDPIAAYFPLHPATMRPKLDSKGNVLKWRQKLPDGRFKDFPKKNIIHFYFDRPPGFIFGKPGLIPVIDDIQALRRIEEHVEILIYKHIFPIFQYIVGTEANPAEIYKDGTTEVDKVKFQLQSMPPEGSFVTPERHEIKPIGFNSILEVKEYLEYFKKRVFSGIGVSAVDMGETDTSNKSTAENASRALIDDTKDYQLAFASFINLFIIRELLLESPWGQNSKIDVLAPENNVFFTFREIDLEALMKRQNHNMAQYQGHAISEDEMRESNGHDKVQEGQRGNMFLELVTARISEFESEARQKEAAMKNSTSSKSTPKNQHGKRSGPRLTKPDSEMLRFLRNYNEIGQISKDHLLLAKFTKNLNLNVKKDKLMGINFLKNAQVLDFSVNQNYISLREKQFMSEVDSKIEAFHRLVSKALSKPLKKSELSTFVEGCYFVLQNDLKQSFDEFVSITSEGNLNG